MHRVNPPAIREPDADEWFELDLREFRDRLDELAAELEPDHDRVAGWTSVPALTGEAIVERLGERLARLVVDPTSREAMLEFVAEERRDAEEVAARRRAWRPPTEEERRAELAEMDALLEASRLERERAAVSAPIASPPRRHVVVSTPRARARERSRSSSRRAAARSPGRKADDPEPPRGRHRNARAAA